MGHFDSSTGEGRGEIGNLSDRFAGLNVRDYSSAESLFQVMKAVEDAEITIREQLEENDRLKGEILQKNHELEKYKLNFDKYLRTSVDTAASSDKLVHTHHAMNISAYPAENVKERSTLMDTGASEGRQHLLFNERENGSTNNSERIHNSQNCRPSSKSFSPDRDKNELNEDQRINSSNGLVPTSEMNDLSSQSKQNLLHKIRDQEEEISLLRRHISDYSVKESKLRNDQYVLEKRIAHMRMAFDQQQKDLVDAAAKALSYRQDIIEENIHLTYALQEAQQEKSTYVSYLLPLLAEYGLQPSTSDALSVVSSIKVLLKHLHEKFIITEEKFKESQYHFGPWCSETGNTSNAVLPLGENLISQPQDLIHFETNPAPKNNLEIVPQPSYSHAYSPVASPFNAQTRADWESLGHLNLQATSHDVIANNVNHGKIGRTSPTSRNHVAEEVPEQVQVSHGNSQVVPLNAENEERHPLIKDIFYWKGLNDSEPSVHQQDEELSLQLISGSTSNIDHVHDDQSHPYLPPVLEEPNSSFSEAAEDDPLPTIEGLQIFGEAFPGKELQACGYSINGTTSCNFEWVRYLEDGTVNYIEGAKHPNYLVTADDVDFYLAIEVQPLDNRKRKGELVKVFANEQRKITCDPQMQMQIERTLSTGHASYEVSISTGVLNFWENAVLVIKKEGYDIKCNNPRGGVMEKFSTNTQIAVCYGQSTEFSIQGANEDKTILKTSSSLLRDTIVLTLRLFKMRAVEKRKVKKKVLFFK